MKSQGASKAGEINWNCRFHPNEGWHEIGCPHRSWTKEQLQDALETAKGSSNMAIEAIQQAIAQERERIVEIVDDTLTPHHFESDHSPTEKILQDTKIRYRDKIIDIITNNHEDHKE